MPQASCLTQGQYVGLRKIGNANTKPRPKGRGFFLPVIVLKTSRTVGRSVGLPGKIGNAHTKPPAMVGVFFAAIVAVTRTDGLLFLFSELRNMQGCALALNRIMSFFNELMTFCNIQKGRKKMRLFCEKLKKSWEVFVLC